MELSEYKLKREYMKKERIDISNINLQTEELHCNYLVYIPSLKKKMYMEYKLQYNYRRLGN